MPDKGLENNKYLAYLGHKMLIRSLQQIGAQSLQSARKCERFTSSQISF